MVENSYAGYGLGINSWDKSYLNPDNTSGIMKNVTFRNMYLEKTWWGIRLRAYSYFNGSTTDYKIINNKIYKFEKAKDIKQYNQSVDKVKEMGDLQNYGWDTFQNISFIDITGSYTEWAGHLDCSGEDKCYDLKFENIDLKAIGNAPGFSCSDNVYGVAVNVTPPLSCLQNFVTGPI